MLRRMAATFGNRAVLLTGASSGIGRALALELAREGARLALVARDAARLEEVAAECRALGAEAVTLPADVGVEAEAVGIVERAVAALGGLDLLLLNAGITMWSKVEEVTDHSIFERLMRVNYLGAVWSTLAALPHLRARRGAIVVVSSLTGLAGVPTRSGYAASKHALHGFFDSLRIELAGSGMAITLACPDFVVSQIHRRALGPDGRPLGRTPMREARLLSAEACARRILAAARRRRRLAILSARGRVGRWVRLVAPGWIDRIAARAIARGH
jgi:short-subunit dehydrogenase